jgi:hypothetical protein
MKKFYIIAMLLVVSYKMYSQTVVLSPCQSPSSEQEVTITFDANGTELSGETNVYAHAGVVINNTNNPVGSDWTAVKGTWGTDNGVGKMTPVSGQPNKWQLVLGPTLRGYFNSLSPANAPIYWLAIVFRNANGSKQTRPDIYIRLNQVISITQPQINDIFLNSGQSLPISASLCSEASSVKISVNEGSGFVDVGSPGTNTNNLTVNFSPTSSGLKVIRVTATIAGVDQSIDRTVNIFSIPTTAIEAIPSGLKKGINYYPSDPTKVTLVLETPVSKQFVYVAGDFNNWQADDGFFMKKTPDGKFFWLTIEGLSSGQEYVFQYWVDGLIKIGDPLAEKVADPWNDQFIPASTYPNLPAYNRQEFGIATVLQTNQTPYTWSASENTWAGPPKNELVVYELLIRDFIGTQSYKTLTDTLNYLKKLGVNAIELMPIMEFEGNNSWGYNPSYFLAPDKNYGSKNDLKKFIETAHQKGFAVILDMVLNHAFGQNPMVQMYWDNGLGKPAANNPWFNPDARHPFNVGYDFNHESQFTKNFVDTVCAYWIQEYHFDGYRFDLSKGFTQTNNPNNVGAWGNYDQSRINLLTRMANKIWSYKPNAYVILEHFADNSEETVLANNGMILWGNLVDSYASALEGNVNTDFSAAKRNSHINYMESHDEERQMVDLLANGKTSGSYNIKELPTALDRAKLGAAFFYTVPGPKMLWQFGELGYDKTINLCPNGSISGNCRVDPKPLPWGSGGLNYYGDPDRQRLYQTIGAINDLINRNKSVFETGTFVWTPAGAIRTIGIQSASMDVAIVGNFSLNIQQVNGFLTKTGTWFDYFGNATLEVTSLSQSVTLAPGEFKIFTTTKQPDQKPGLVGSIITSVESNDKFEWYPNPSEDLLMIPITHTDFAMVDILTTTGQRLLQVSFENPSNTLEVNVSEVPSGLHIVRVQTSQKTEVKKIIFK